MEKFNINSVSCKNCNHFKITPISRLIFIMMLLCTVFIVTIPFIPLLFLGWLLIVFAKGKRFEHIKKYVCMNCQAKYTRNEVEEMFNNLKAKQET